MRRLTVGESRIMPFVVGLTGGIGSGKSLVGAFFGRHGATVVDADAESRALTAAGGAALKPIGEAFGAGYITLEGGLDRARMRERVFDDPRARARLEAILHPLIQAECARKVMAAPGPYVILMIPLLVESGGPHRRVHRVALVDCRESTQIERVMKRDGLPRESVIKIIAAQASRDERRAAADDIIDNDGPESALLPQIDSLHRSYLAIAQATAWRWPPPG